MTLSTFCLLSLLIAALTGFVRTQSDEDADCAVFAQLFTQSGKPIPWAGNASCCTSDFYVGCEGGRVVTGYFAAQGLSGGIPASLNSVTHLRTLYLDYNDLTGPIPNISALNKLEELYLQGNRLTTLSDMSALSSLTTLYVYNNSLAGRVDGLIPSAIKYCYLTYKATNPGLFTCGAGVPQPCFSLDQTIPPAPCPISLPTDSTSSAAYTSAIVVAASSTTSPSATGAATPPSPNSLTITSFSSATAVATPSSSSTNQTEGMRSGAQSGSQIGIGAVIKSLFAATLVVLLELALA